MPEVQAKYSASQSSIFFLCAVNFFLGWLEGKNLLLVPRPADSDSIRWGVFAGEALFAITWISLGPQPFLRRAVASLNWGLCLSIMNWLGYFVGYGSKAWIYKIEFGYIVPLLVIAFFREKLRFYSVLMPLVTLMAVHQIVVANFPIPAGRGSYTAYRAGGILAFATAAVVAYLCFEKRLQGYRLQGLDKPLRSE